MVPEVETGQIKNRNTEDAIYFNFSYAALKLLGKNLYNNAANAISELVANGLDAKAKNVYVYIDMSDKEHSIIEIIDDGIGMDYADLAQKYVWIGRNKRNDADLLEDEKKNVMGRKGIGKLAALYLSNNYYILTKKEDIDKVDQWEINLSVYNDSDFPKLDRVTEKICLVNNSVSNIGHNYIQQVILTYIAQLKMVDYNTFSKRDKFKISYALFYQQVDEIEGLVRKFFELQIIYNHVKISSLKSRDISGDVTTSSVEMCQALQEKKKELENCLVLVENFGIVFEEIDKKNFYWTKAKKKIDAMAKKIEADVNAV